MFARALDNAAFTAPMVVPIVCAVSSSDCPSTSLRIAALRCVGGSSAKDRQRRFHERWIDAGFFRLCAVRDVGNGFHVLAFVAFDKVHSRVMRDPEEPGFEVRRLHHLAQSVIRFC